MSISIYDKDYFRNTSGALNLVSLFLLRCIIVFITIYHCFYYDASLFLLRCIIVFITMYHCFYYDVSLFLIRCIIHFNFWRQSSKNVHSHLVLIWSWFLLCNFIFFQNVSPGSTIFRFPFCFLFVCLFVFVFILFKTNDCICQQRNGC